MTILQITSSLPVARTNQPPHIRRLRLMLIVLWGLMDLSQPFSLQIRPEACAVPPRLLGAISMDGFIRSHKGVCSSPTTPTTQATSIEKSKICNMPIPSAKSPEKSRSRGIDSQRYGRAPVRNPIPFRAELVRIHWYCSPLAL